MAILGNYKNGYRDICLNSKTQFIVEDNKKHELVDLPSPKEIRELLDYNPHTGELTWRCRTLDMYDHCKKPDRACRKFNKNNVGKSALDFIKNGYHTCIIFKIRRYAHHVAYCHYHEEWVGKINIFDGNNNNLRISNLCPVKQVDRKMTAHNFLDCFSSNGYELYGCEQMETSVIAMLKRVERNWGWCIANKEYIQKIDAGKWNLKIKNHIQKIKDISCEKRKPVKYDEDNYGHVQEDRDMLAKEQKYLCWHCNEPLEGKPPKYLACREDEINERFSQKKQYAIHLHHCHQTGYAFGTTHAVCNGVLWIDYDE